jgi:hypothetical protein
LSCESGFFFYYDKHKQLLCASSLQETYSAYERLETLFKAAREVATRGCEEGVMRWQKKLVLGELCKEVILPDKKANEKRTSSAKNGTSFLWDAISGQAKRKKLKKKLHLRNNKKNSGETRERTAREESSKKNQRGQKENGKKKNLGK